MDVMFEECFQSVDVLAVSERSNSELVQRKQELVSVFATIAMFVKPAQKRDLREVAILNEVVLYLFETMIGPDILSTDRRNAIC